MFTTGPTEFEEVSEKISSAVVEALLKTRKKNSTIYYGNVFFGKANG